VAAKYAVVGLSHTPRAEGARLGVKVSVVCPGLIDTPILVNSPIRGSGDRETLRSLIPTPMPADRCALAIFRGVAKNRSTIVVTGHARALWRLARLSPDGVIWLATPGDCAHAQGRRARLNGPPRVALATGRPPAPRAAQPEADVERPLARRSS
jgi:NAD(P)-dependent dehydrogenase (short-subunit alcohol dehydrogenase family)